jgi:hypothetical protein
METPGPILVRDHGPLEGSLKVAYAPAPFRPSCARFGPTNAAFCPTAKAGHFEISSEHRPTSTPGMHGNRLKGIPLIVRGWGGGGVGEREDEAGAREGASAQAGAGDPPERSPSPSPPKPKRKHGGGRKRGDAVPVPDPDTERLIRVIGGDKPAPDVSAEERHYSRSLRIRRLVMEYLATNVGSTWRHPTELHARAANYAGCSSVTAARWVYQFTRVGMPYQLVDAVEYWVLEKREG